MQTLQQGLQEYHLKIATNLMQEWRDRLVNQCPEYSQKTRESIICWLMGKDLERFEQLDSLELALAQQAMAYRYRILRQRYLGVAPKQAYYHLTKKLGSLVLLRNKIQALAAFSHERASALADILQEVIQDLLQRDRYMQQQVAWIAECTSEPKLRNALVLATMEEYCLRPIRNQPLLIYRFVSYLRRTQQGGVTQLPKNQILRPLSDEVLVDDSDDSFSLPDTLAAAEYKHVQDLEERQALRMIVHKEFANYLGTQIGPIAVRWLHLYLQGKSQEAIAQQLSLSVKQVYRLREKISYHAVRVFGLKQQPELVSYWLETSLMEHNLGLTHQQWQQFWARLTPQQRQVIDLKMDGKNLEAIASALNYKLKRVRNEWYQLCLAAQAVRNEA